MKLRYLFGSSKPSAINLPDDDFFARLRKSEYSRLSSNKHSYLDFTGGNLYANSQVKKHQELLLSDVFGNPHSTNPTSKKATELVEETRARVLEFFNATEDYFCIFTQNATGALKIVGECYPFNDNSTFVLLADNHNSVNGIREFCKAKGGKTTYVPVQYEDLQINDELLQKSLEEGMQYTTRLFAFPAQSNVSGSKHDLNWIQKAHDMGYDVLLDAAAFVPTTKLDLSKVKPDFVSVSFYKIFGYPTGLGCLLLRKSAFPKLQKPWFAGGTVTLVSVAAQQQFLANGHERFEDGTINYLDIPAIKIGLDYIDSIGIDRINRRVMGLIKYAMDELRNIKHDSGKTVVKLFGSDDLSKRGANVIMNFFDKEGQVIPFEEIEQVTNKAMISIRSGCFCNPGIDEINNCITTEEMSKYFVSRDKGDYYDMINYLGKMRGATRVSVGISTTKEDIDRFVEVVGSFRNR